METVVTPRGPVIIGGPEDDEAFSIATPAHRDRDVGLGALLPLLRSRSSADVVAAFDRWVEPVNNLITADRDGTIGHHIVGRVPDRRTFGPRPVPVPAWSAETRWAATRSDLPVVDPRDGAVVTANDRAHADYDRFTIACAPAFRADRIRERLAERDRWSAETIREVLADTRQTAGATLLDAIAELTELTAAAAELARELAAWDRQMSTGSVTAARFDQVRTTIVARLVADGPWSALQRTSPDSPIFDPWYALEPRVLRALPRLLALPHGEQARLLGLNLADVIRQALEEVALQPTMEPWGKRHRFTPIGVHTGFGLPDRSPDALGRALAGDSDCVAATTTIPGSPYCVRGPVARYVWDLARPHPTGAWAVPLGTAGDPADPQAGDQFEAWSSGRLTPLSPPAETTTS